MKTLALASLAFLVLAAAAPSLAQDEPPEKPPVAVFMDHMGETLRAVRDEMKQDPAGAAEALIDLQSRACLAKQHLPTKYSGFEAGEERTRAVVAFRKHVNELVAALQKLEEALLDGDVDAAQVVFKELKELERAGHAEHTRQW